MKVKLLFLSAALILGALTSCQKTDLSGVEKGISDAQTKIEKLQADLSTISESLGLLPGKATTDSLRARVSALETSLAEMKTTVAGLSSEGEEVKDELEAIQAEILLLTGAIEELAGQIGGSLVQSIVFVPKFKGVSAVVENPDSLVLDYAVSPAAAGKMIADGWNGGDHSILQAKIKAVSLRSGLLPATLDINTVSFTDSDSLLSVTVSIAPVEDILFSDANALAISLGIVAEGANVSSPFTDIDAVLRTVAASGITPVKMQLNGKYSTLAPALEKSAGFYYIEGEETSAQVIKGDGTKVEATLGEDGTFSFPLRGLTLGDTYSYLAYVSINGSELTGQVLSATSAPMSMEVVDLGLSVKWAAWNLGAFSPEEYGDYYAWGATEPWYEDGYARTIPTVWKPGKEAGYDDENCPFVDEHGDFTKYVINSDEPYYDGKYVLEAEDDAATVNLGQGWRMPTEDEFDELISECTWQLEIVNGIRCMKATSKNGNHILFPGAAYRDSDDGDEDLNQALGWEGCYWSSVLLSQSEANYMSLDLEDVRARIRSTYRPAGCSIRPVYSEGQLPEVLSRQGCANCYIVKKAGSYKFNAEHKGSSDTGLGDSVTEAEVLWESFGTGTAPAEGDLVRDVKLIGNYIQFTATDKKGNAVIAVKNNDGKVLWSWHIWLTDQPGEQIYNNGVGIMMDRNLGATSATPADGAATFGLLYQWGRKDPFLGSSSANGTVRVASTNPDCWKIEDAGDHLGEVEDYTYYGDDYTYGYAKQNPTVFLKSEDAPFDWFCTAEGHQCDYLWDNYSTESNPCPPGWRVPSPDLWYKAFGVNEEDVVSIADKWNGGVNLENLSSSAAVWYPATGYLNHTDGSLIGVGTGFSVWSYSPSAFLMKVEGQDESLYPHYTESLQRAAGRSVRCFKANNGSGY